MKKSNNNQELNMQEKVLLSDIQDLLSNKHKYFLSEHKGYQGVSGGKYGYGDGVQGEHDETFKYYRHPGLPEDVLMKETYHTDSYGHNDGLVKIEFVKAKAKTITVYEPID